MRYYVVIPAHNEEKYIGHTLASIAAQSLPPAKVIIVNDNSSDGTEDIIDRFCRENDHFIKLNNRSSELHMPGSKVVKAFDAGLDLLDDHYDFLAKVDADLIFPEDYFSQISAVFTADEQCGIAGGFAYEKTAEGWILNHPMNKDHVRGAFKAYTNSCFKAIGGLRASIGWDTVDELLARYHHFSIKTVPALKVKHLRPTGGGYSEKARILQGEAMYKMRYGFFISLVASLKMAVKQQNIDVLRHNLKGYLQASRKKLDFIVTPEEGIFIRKHRLSGIINKLRIEQ